MDKYRIKHRWKEVGFGIKRCRRCKLIYYSSKRFLDPDIGYYQKYHTCKKEFFKNHWDIPGEGEIRIYHYVKEEDFVGKEVNCTEGIIADILF